MMAKDNSNAEWTGLENAEWTGLENYSAILFLQSKRFDLEECVHHVSELESNPLVVRTNRVQREVDLGHV
jgi:hypothetical protein